MRETDEMENCQALVLWTREIEQSFNVVSIGSIFGNKNNSVILGHEDGIVRVYPLPNSGDAHTTKYLECERSLETKGGPIQCLMIHNVTKLNQNDVTVADSRGMVTIFSKGQILIRKAVSEQCIQCLTRQTDALGRNTIVTTDRQGHVVSFTPFSDHWKLRLSDLSQFKSFSYRPHVTSLHVTELSDVRGQRRSYVLMADTCKMVHVIQGGDIILTLHTPAVVTAMTSGRFVDPESISVANGNSGSQAIRGQEMQVAMGTESGAIYIMANFQVYQEEFANIQHSIKLLETLPAADTQPTDTLLCGGHLDALCVIREGQEVCRHRTSAWVTSLVTMDINNDGVQEVVMGCHDNTIHALRLTFS